MALQFNSLSLGTKLNTLIQVVLMVVLSIAHYWILGHNKRVILDGAERRAAISADGVINGMNMLMVTGMITNPDNRRLFIKKMSESQGVKELHIVRAKQVQDQFGPGLPEEQARDNMDRRAMETKRPQLKFTENRNEPTLRTVVPFIVSTNFRGTNCLQCHHVKVGSVNGAASITIDLVDEFDAIRRVKEILWFGQIMLQLILFFSIRWLIIRFTRPLVNLQASMETMRLSGGLEHFIPFELGNAGKDEIGKLAAVFNTMADELNSYIRAIGQHALISVTDKGGRITRINDKFCEISGYSQDELIGQNHRILKSGTHPKEFFVQLWATIVRGNIWRGEICNRTKSGTLYWVDSAIVPIRDANGHVNSYLSIRIDTTKRKQLEEQMRQANMVYQNSSEGVVITDENNLIVAVNPAFTKITGYTFDEVKDKNPKMFSSGRHDQAFFQVMWESLNSTGHWQGEIWDKRKNGEIHARLLTINTICDEDGSVHRYVALFSDITERKQSEELIWQQANFDTLTGLSNRRMFREHLMRECMLTDRTRLPLALLMIDLDRFKEVNDTLGHDMGDVLLKEAALRMASCVRQTDAVARLGGDEFAVVLSQLTASSRVEDIAKKILDKLATPFQLSNEIVYISGSVGIALYPNDTSDIETLMKYSDQAMYLSKQQGRNRFSFFTQALQEGAQQRLRLTNDLRGALALNQFQVYYQPIVELTNGNIHKAEALIRWHHPERGLISPAEFIPLAEATGLIVDIEDWVFKETVHQVKHWQEVFNAAFQISVNRSPVQFQGHLENERIPCIDYLKDQIKLSGQSIVFEITEGLLLDTNAGVLDMLLQCHDAGIQISLDDFGTGYSSLSYLKKFDIDYLKIDRSFVEDLTTDASDEALCEAIIVMAHKLGLKVIAEGVETTVQRDLLKQAGCDFAQGYLYSKPVPAEEFEKLLKHV